MAVNGLSFFSPYDGKNYTQTSIRLRTYQTDKALHSTLMVPYTLTRIKVRHPAEYFVLFLFYFADKLTTETEKQNIHDSVVKWLKSSSTNKTKETNNKQLQELL